MDFEGYDEEDWRVDFDGIVRSFLTDESSPKGPEMVGKLTRSSSLSSEDREYMQRYLQLKYAILFMQRRKTFGKYCFYGCWCMPKGALDIGVGQGHPVDAIDQSCHDFATCYNCLYSREIGRECDESDTGNYRMTGRNNPVTGEKTLTCTDPIDSCLRMRCECDLQLARKLAQHEDEWNVNHHRRWGDNPFNAAESCRAQHATTADSSEALTAQPQHQPVNDDGSVTNDKFDDPDLGYVTVPELTTSSPPYFADYDTDQPQNKTLSDGARPNVADYSAEVSMAPSRNPLHGKIVGCCGRAPNVHYYREGQQCCPNGRIVEQDATCSE